MTEGEAIEAAAAAAANAFTSFTIFISFTFAFLVTSYFVGSKLSRFQTLAAIGLYIVAGGFMALAMIAWTQALFAITGKNETVLNTVYLIQRGYWVEVLSVLLGTGMLVSLYFMWDVRRQRPE